MFRLSVVVVLWMVFGGCATPPVSPEALEQQAEADLVVTFQSWNSLWLIKPDITGMAGAMQSRIKTFTSAGFVKLLHNLETPRDFVVVVLDRTYSPDPMVANGGMDAVQAFFEELGFRRIVLQDGAALSGAGGRVVLRDTSTKSGSAG
jgi:hypothetical protein